MKATIALLENTNDNYVIVMGYASIGNKQKKRFALLLFAHSHLSTIYATMTFFVFFFVFFDCFLT